VQTEENQEQGKKDSRLSGWESNRVSTDRYRNTTGTTRIQVKPAW